MSKTQMISASSGPGSSGFATSAEGEVSRGRISAPGSGCGATLGGAVMCAPSSRKGPSLPLAMPLMSRQSTSARLSTTYTRSPSTLGSEESPVFGQSKNGSSSRFGTTSCQRRCPSFSSRHIITPRSPWCFGSRGSSLFVPTKTRPCATIGVAWPSDPSFATHLIFFPVFGSKVSGKPRSSETMFRVHASPHCGWSAAKADRDARAQRIELAASKVEKRQTRMGPSA